MAAVVVANPSPRLELGSAPMVLAHSLLGLELALDTVELRRRAVQPPAVAQQRDRRNDRDPDRPELTAGAVAEPDHRADHEQPQRSTHLLKDAALEVAAALGELGPTLLRGHR